MKYYLEVLKKYAVFNGRATRSEYWFFFLFNIIISIALSIVDGVLGTFILGMVYGIALIIPGLAVGVRRLHDTGRSGWWLLIGLIPLVGAIVLIIFLVGDSAEGENKYGPNPKVAKPAVS